MAQNSLLTPSIIAMAAMEKLKNSMKFTKRINRQYSAQFARDGAKIGSTITIRKPVRFTTRTGPALQVQALTEESQALTLSTQRGADFVFNSADLTLTVDDFMNRYVNQAITTVANFVDVDNLAMAYENTWNYVGTPGTTPSTALLYMQAMQKINEQACPEDDERAYFINPGAQPVIVDTLKGLYQSAELISEQYRTGAMGKGLGGDWYMTQNIQNRTVGALGGTPTVNGAGQTGSSLATAGWSNSITGLLNVGDRFTIAGVYSVNPVTKQATQSLQCFVVTAAANSNGSGQATVQISPSIVTSGALQTVSAAPANSAAITVSGAAGTLSPQNLALHKDAFLFGCADMELPEGVHFKARAVDAESGLSIRIVRQYDINSDTIPCRLDILYGSCPGRNEWACAIQG